MKHFFPNQEQKERLQESRNWIIKRLKIRKVALFMERNPVMVITRRESGQGVYQRVKPKEIKRRIIQKIRGRRKNSAKETVKIISLSSLTKTTTDIFCLILKKKLTSKLQN